MPFYTRILIGCTLLVFLAGCGGQGNNDAHQAQQQFIQERSGTPVVSVAEQANRPIAGTIERIDSGSLIVKNEMEDISTTVQLSDETVVTRQQQSTLAELAPRTEVIVLGNKTDTGFWAFSISTGGAMVSLEQPMVLKRTKNGPSVENAPPLSDRKQTVQIGDGGTSQIMSLKGTVEQVNSIGLTLKGDDGQITTVTLDKGGHVVTETAATSSDLAAGMSIIAHVNRDGSRIQAKRITIVSTE